MPSKTTNNTTSEIQSNVNSAQTEYNSSYAQLLTDIESLNTTVNKTINDEVDRLIPKEEKSRIMRNTSSKTIDSLISGLKPSDYFTITGVDASSIPNAMQIAKDSMKPSDIIRPSNVDETTWNSYTPDQKKDAVLADTSKLEEFVFKGMPTTEKRSYIKADPAIYFDMLPDSEKLYLIAQYTQSEDEELGNTSKFMDKLDKSQKRKDQLKSSIKKKATKLLTSLQQTIDQNKALINTLKSEISAEKAELHKLQTTPIDITKFSEFYKSKNPNVKVPPIDELKKLAKADREDTIKALKKSIKDKETDLQSAITENSKAIETIESLKKSLETKLASKDIFVGDQAISEDSQSTTDSTLPSMAANTFGSENPDPNLPQSKKAKNMMKNMIEKTDLETFRDYLQQYSYQDLVAMAKKLKGPFNKNNLDDFLSVAYNDMKKSDTDSKAFGPIKKLLEKKCGITKVSQLTDMNSLSNEQLQNVQFLLMDLNNNYSTKPQAEKDQIDLLMQYVKLGMLKRECEHFKFFKNLVRNREQKQRFNMLTTQLEKHAENQYTERNSILDNLNEFRKRIKQPPIDKSKKLRSPQTPHRNTYDAHEL